MMGFLSMNHPAPRARRSAHDLGGDVALGKPGFTGDRIDRCRLRKARRRFPEELDMTADAREPATAA
ncbi:hypothetical protein ACFQ15_18890 [Sphingomonas hankookensis]|uniref:hypothetical protein n=1 Tax=Sphingomonas hankookensis TaxID=563996 RepID=UPI001F589CCF|nr:hypothetical protein [Sphingomonas hankookensis]